MGPENAAAEPNTITVELSRSQISLIGPGLSYIVRAYLMQRQVGTVPTSYPFRMYPPPRGFDSGTFDPSAMDKFRSLLDKVQPSKRTARRIWLDAFELRAAAFSTRTTLRMRRFKFREARKSHSQSSPVLNSEKGAIARQAFATRRFIKVLERAMKRANRRFLLTATRDEFRELSKEWQSHLRWIRFRLTYFKPIRQFGVPLRKRYQDDINRLVKMAEDAIRARKLRLPSPKSLRHVIRLFLAASRRARVGRYDHVYMITHTDSPAAQARLFDFIERRLFLERAL